MTESAARGTFDPYYKWLGIPPKDQPPHYYRLLAIDVFESDADVISAAADKQMAYIRSFQSGKHSQLSQKLLNEIAAARVCLLNGAKKSDYDRTLRARLAQTASGTDEEEPIQASAATSPDDPILIVPELADLGPLPSHLGGGKRSPLRKKKATVLPLMALGAMLVVSAVVITVVMSSRPQTQFSQAAGDHGPPKNSEASSAHPTMQDGTTPAPANSGKPAIRPMESHGSANAATTAKLPETGVVANASQNDPNSTSSGETQADTKPAGHDDYSAGKPRPVSTPDAQTMPAQVEPSKVKKYKTLEELDKELADAKTSDDYRMLASEALRSAGKANDDHQADAAKQFLRKSLLAARKSQDNKLIVKATRALIKPEAVKEILAEPDKPGD
jgi:hypothetical protein